MNKADQTTVGASLRLIRKESVAALENVHVSFGDRKVLRGAISARFLRILREIAP